MALTPNTRLGPYDIVAAIGAGGMGEVFRATDSRLNRDVALKALPDALAADPDRVARFKREAQVLASLNHPNVAAIYGLEESSGDADQPVVRALVMELVDGLTLADRLAQGSPPLDEVIAIARQLAEAIEYAHDQGVIHRDLKPANIKITPAGTVKVLDFGLAKALGDDPAGSASRANSPTLSLAGTQAGLILGTAAYMSPEQAKGKPADRRADVWSFGIVLFEMLTGREPYSGETVSETMAAVIMKEPDWTTVPATTPPRLAALLRRCLVKDPRKRLQSIGEARIALEEPLEDVTVQAVAVSSSTPATRRGWAALLGVAAAALMVGALAAGSLAWTFKPEPPRAITRFSLPLAEGQAFTNTGVRVLALSPDGRHLVYVANQRLYLREMSSLESRVIQGSDLHGAIRSVVFSPDGQSVAFQVVADETIRRLALSGGAAVTVAQAQLLMGMNWDEQGIVVATRNNGILRVSANGGTPEVIVARQEGEMVAAPQMLPGGRTVLFSTKKTAELWDKGQVVVQPLDGGPRKTVIDGGADARYVATGHLVYALGGIVLAVPFDLESLSVTGGPVPVVEGVQRSSGTTTATGTAQFAHAANGTLVYWPGPVSVSASTGNDLALFGRKGGVQPLKLPPRLYRAARVSPDGRFVAFDSTDDTEAIVWVHELSGASAIRRLTFDGKNRAPVWSHDGQWILFQSDREGDLAIFRQRADGAGVAERLTRPEAGTAHWPQSVARDGVHLLFSVIKEGQPPALWTLRLKDRGAEVLAGINAREAVFSPDGRWIAYQAAPSAGVFLEPFPRTGAKYQIPQSGGHPFWSPKGNEIFLNTAQTSSGVVPVTTAPVVTFGQPADFARLGRVEQNPATARRDTDMLPDGERVVGVLRQGATPGDDGEVEAQQITVVLNWFDDLRRRVPTIGK